MFVCYKTLSEDLQGNDMKKEERISRYDLVIIGAGAAGLAAATYASRHQKGLSILVLEKEKLPGRKLSAAGNGKCNLTNTAFGADCYHSHNSRWVTKWAASHSYTEILRFFEESGILLYEKNGYVYPVSNQGKQVTGLLFEECREGGVRFLFQARVTSIEPPGKEKHGRYHISADTPGGETLSFLSENVIICTGGRAAPALGGCVYGYGLAEQLGLKIQPCYPVLAPIYVDDARLGIAKGTRVDAAVSLRLQNRDVIRETGQVQFNTDCLSGIVIMNLSSYVERKLYCGKDSLSLDVLPEITWDRLRAILDSRQESFPSMTVMDAMNGLLPVSLNAYILDRVKLPGETKLIQLTEKHKNRLTSAIKKLVFTPVENGQYDKAQATGGGIVLEEINEKTSEAHRHPGLYVCGEVLDVDGKCGGYNLTFALLTGIQAASNIISR